ncbi:MAG TPA: peptidylprolyl isomerase [Terriglobales bacterium]|nr:peptidylprolyl isomerase [Terriglobales bacterium]
MCGTKVARLAVPLALASAVLLSACRRDEKAPSPVSRVADFVQGKLKRGPVLRVESREFTNEDLADYVRATGGSDAKKLSADSLSRLYDRFVDEKILLEAARRRNMTLTWEEKKAYLAKIAAESDPDKTAPPPDPAAPEGVFDGLLIEKYDYQVVKDIKVEEAEVRAYYDEHKKDFLLSERVQVSQILVPTEQRAVAVLRRVGNAPEAEFRKAAREESSGPEAFKGGVMGVYRQGDLPYDMEKVIFAMDVGSVSRVVESSYGYHIFRLDAKFPPQLQSLAEAAPAVRVRVLERKIGEALTAHLAGLKDTLSWQAFPENLFFAYQRITS